MWLAVEGSLISFLALSPDTYTFPANPSRYPYHRSSSESCGIIRECLHGRRTEATRLINNGRNRRMYLSNILAIHVKNHLGVYIRPK